MRSQASQSRCEKQALPPSNSVSASSCHSPYQPTAEPLMSNAGVRSSRPISRTTSRVIFSRERRMRRRLRSVHGALAIGSPARLTIVSMRSSFGIWSSEVTSRNGGANTAAFRGSRTSTVT